MLASMINWQKRKHGLTPVSIFYREDAFPVNLTQLKRFTSFTNAFFLLRVPLTMSGQPATIGSSKGMLTLSDSKCPDLHITFDALFKDVSTVVKKYGLSVTNNWCDDVPVFELKHLTLEGMKKFVRSAEKVQDELASRISAHFAEQPAPSHSSTAYPLVTVHPKVFLLTPDPNKKNAGLALVTPENLSTCLMQWEESKVFKFADLFRAYRMDDSTANDSKIRSIEAVTPSPDQDSTVDETKTMPDDGTPSPDRDVCDPTPRSREREPNPKFDEEHKPIQKHLYHRAEEIQNDIGSNDAAVALKKQALSEAQDARDTARGRLNEAEEKRLEAKTNVAMLTEKVTSNHRQLQLKEQELNVLQKVQEKENKELQALIKRKNEEFQVLQQELKAVQNELTLEEEKARYFQEQFQQASGELVDKSARVQGLEREQRKLETQLEIERLKAGQLLMLATAASKSQHHQEIEHQLKVAKQEVEEKNKEMNALKESVAHTSGEVKGLSAQLQAKDDLLQKLLTQSTHAAQEQLQRLTAEMSELRSRLSKAEDEQQKAQLQMYTAHLKHELLQNVVTTLPDELSSPEETSWEYTVFSKKSAEIMESLANVPLAARIADKLYADHIIGNDVKQRAHIYAGFTEIDRVRPIITALMAKIRHNAQLYHSFRGILVSFEPDTETALFYMPENDPTAVTPSHADQDSAGDEAKSMKAPSPNQEPTATEGTPTQAVTPSPDQDPTTANAETEEDVPPSQDRGQATGQQRITIRGIRWRKASDAPASMYRGAAASHGNMAYFNPGGSTALYCYESQQQQWRRLPDCPSKNSALVMIEGRLTTVGGWQYPRPTNSLASLTGEDEDSKWVELFPRMPTARYDLAAVCRGRNVIAAGGSDGGRIVSAVEILDTELRQWSSAASLPHPMTRASITVCEDLLYLLGGLDQNGDRTLSVLTSSITELLHQQQETANQPAAWRRTADAPYYGSTAVSVGGQLLAIGGQDEHYEDTSAIVGYDPTSDSWQDMGHMATPRYATLVAVLPSNQLIAAGGYGGLTKVEIGNVV